MGLLRFGEGSFWHKILSHLNVPISVLKQVVEPLCVEMLTAVASVQPVVICDGQEQLLQAVIRLRGRSFMASMWDELPQECRVLLHAEMDRQLIRDRGQ